MLLAGQQAGGAGCLHDWTETAEGCECEQFDVELSDSADKIDSSQLPDERA